VILVDDGIATGSTVTAAVRVARDLGAGRVVVATPVAPEDTVRSLRRIADEVVVIESPQPFYAVGQAYLAFGQTGDDEVQQILTAHAYVQGDELQRTA
jgi:putative phosphoribosyl transferase